MGVKVIVLFEDWSGKCEGQINEKKGRKKHDRKDLMGVILTLLTFNKLVSSRYWGRVRMNSLIFSSCAVPLRLCGVNSFLNI